MATVYGNTGNVRQVGEVTSVAELMTMEVRIVGDFDALYSSYRQGDAYGSEFIKSLTIQHEEGGRAVAALSIVGGLGTSTSGGTSYGTTWGVDIREVSKSLKTHPYVKDALDIIRMWEATPEGRRVKYGDKGSRTYRYYDTDGASAEDEPKLVDVEDERAIAYMDAVFAGIESYNVYLPVVRRITYHVSRPTQSGVGTFDTPDGFSLTGFIPDGESGLWFKSADKASKQADGLWTQTEEWTWTNDLAHGWIYGLEEE